MYNMYTYTVPVCFKKDMQSSLVLLHRDRALVVKLERGGGVNLTSLTQHYSLSNNNIPHALAVTPSLYYCRNLTNLLLLICS